MAFYYSANVSHATSASAATQTLAASIRTGTTNEAHLSRLLCGAKGAAQDNQTLLQVWRTAVTNTAGTAQVPTVHANGAPAAVSVFQTTPTVGTKGNFPSVALPFNSRAMVQWVALNPDETIAAFAGNGGTTSLEFYDEEAAAVAVTIVYTPTWYEG